MVVLVGDIAAANSSHREFFSIWERFGVLPERYLLDRQILHPTEKYYPLRPELAESTFYLYHATKEKLNQRAKLHSMKSLPFFCRCKYLYLLFDGSFLVDRNYIFTTEGHPLPILSAWHERLPDTYIPSNWTIVKVTFLLFL
ncbi:hypothetical protein U1Q18_007345 [Sarracenia purpurea var. burkii]